MPGTELTVDQRSELVGRLTLVGWLFAFAPIGLIAYQLERVRDVGAQPFAGVWEQRIEVLSFLVLPPNMVVLAPATLAVAIAVWLAGTERGPWLSGLLTLVAGIAITLAVVGVVSIVSIFVNDAAGARDMGGVYLRVGGTFLASGCALLCRTADRPSPAG